MSKYLESFIKGIPAIQGKQIISVLNGLRQSGSITSVKEYSEKLQEMSQILSQGKPMPISEIFIDEAGDTIDSESFSFMMERFGDDLDTLLGEVSLISNVADAHKAIISDKIIKNLELSLGSLERDIKKYEALNRSDIGFSIVQYNDFSDQDELRFSRSTTGVSRDLFYDRGVKNVLVPKYDSSVDVIAKSLSLPIKGDDHTITNVEIEYATNTEAEMFNIDFPEFNLDMIADRSRNTYWITSIMAKDIVRSGAVVELTLTLDGLRDVTYIRVDPILYNSFYVNKIYYIDKNDEQQQILDSDSAVLIDEPKNISFSKVTTRKIIVELLQKSYVQTSYYTNSVDTMYDSYIREADIDIQTFIEAMASEDPRIADSFIYLSDAEAKTKKQVNGYAYVIGMDNIYVGTSEYIGTGIYVSKPLIADSAILMALETKETYEYISDDPDHPKGNIEYSVYKRNYDSSGTPIDTEIFPILPSDSADIKKEYMAVDQSTRKANIRFRATTGTVLVFADDSTTPLQGRDEGDDPTPGDHYEISASGSVITFLADDPAEDVIYNPFTVYTVSYTPIKDVYLNSAATVFMDNANIIKFTNDRAVLPVVKSDIYLTTIMRRHAIEPSYSPRIAEYKMFVALQDDERFASGIQ